MKPTANNLALADIYQLSIHRLQRNGRNGEVLGKGAGTSTDFLDHRPYTAGDDIRRIDWRAYARTDQLLLKRFQEEIRPVVEIWLDGSASMSLSPQKEQLGIDLACFLYRISRVAGVDVQVRILGEGKCNPEQLLAGDIQFVGREALGESVRREMLSIRQGAHVFLLSDFLSPHDPSRMIAGVMNKAVVVTAIQILATEDTNIEEGSSILLQDSETEELIEIDLDARTIAAYHNRLAQLQEDLERELLHWGGQFQLWPCELDFSTGCNQLVQKEVLIL